MIVYGDILFVENFITGSVLLYLTAVIFRVDLHRKKRLLRFVCGSMMCGGIAFVLFLPVGMPWNIALEGVFAVLVCLVVFGRRGVLLRAAAFAALTGRNDSGFAARLWSYGYVCAGRDLHR